MSSKPLRAVAPDEKPPAKGKAKSVADAAREGDQLGLLIAMRDRIAEAVVKPDCPPRDLASLTRRLQDIAEKIEALRLQQMQEQEGDAGGPADEAWDSQAL